MNLVTASYIIDELIIEEKNAGLYLESINGFTVWRLFRRSCRERYFKKRIMGYAYESRRRFSLLYVLGLLKSILLSFFSVIAMILTRKKVENIVFSFPRLQKIQGEWMDKFTDPVIDNSNLNESVCVFQRVAGRQIYKGKRYKKERVIKSDCIIVFSYFVSLFYFPLCFFMNSAKTVYKTFAKAKKIYVLKKSVYFNWIYKYCVFSVSSLLHEYLFKKLKCKRIFIVCRNNRLDQIFAAHRCKIQVYEFQHGVAINHDIYAGMYDKMADPDWFLAFGKMWLGEQFVVPLERQINIGWAFKLITNNIPNFDMFSSNIVLIISSPEISRKIIDAVVSLSQKYTDCTFHIRLHPDEGLTEELYNKICPIPNIIIADNSIDSFIALRSYKHIIGENSSVLFEGLSLGKNVGRFSYNDFSPERLANVEDDGFYYLYKEDDFIGFVKRENYEKNNAAYSEFSPEIVNNLILDVK